MQNQQSNELSVVQVRVARPTDRLKEIVRFYCDGLGLKQIDSFEDHAGYDGVMIALPGRRDHLEFTQHVDGSPCPAPTKDNLLVFYIEDKQAIDHIVARLQEHGYQPVPPENPYWAEKGITFEDSDGWRIVLMNTGGI